MQSGPDAVIELDDQTSAVPAVLDPGRLSALDAHLILDTPAEDGFDDIVRLAARLCAAPVALVSLVAADRQWFKARVNFPSCETDLDRSVCRYALAEPDLLVIPDLTADSRTATNPLVTGEPRIRFYAGAPLRLPDGHVLGSLCIIDTIPRPAGLTPEEADDLRALGRQVSGLISMRAAVERRDAVLDGQEAELRRARRVDVIAKAAAALAVVRDPTAVLEPILAEGAASVGFEQCFIYDLAPDQEHLHLVQSVGTSEAARAALGRAHLDGPLCGIVVRTRGPVVLTDIQASRDPRHAMAREAGINGFAGYPILSRGQIVGVVSFTTGTPSFDGEALGFFATLARLMSGVRERVDSERALRESEARARRAQEAGRVGTFELDVETGLMSVSPEFARLYGRPVAGLYSAAAIEAQVVPEDRAIPSNALTRRSGTAEPDVEYRIHRTDDGELRWIARRASFERDEVGRVTRMFGTVQDVTERKQVQDALREREEQLRLVIEGARDYAIVTTDPAGTITTWSAGACAAFGWSAEEAIGRPIADLFTPEDRAAGVPAHELRTARANGCATDELWHITKDGALVFMNGSVHPLPRDARGRERGFIKIARDETGRRRMEDALRRSEARFRALATAGAQTIYRMSPDWQEMRQLDGAGFLADTQAPSTRWLDLYIDPADRPQVLAAIDDAVRRKAVFEFEHRVRRLDGTLGWTLSRAVPILDEQGTIVEWFGAASDVTARHEAQAALRASEEHWRGLFERLSEGFIVGELVRDTGGAVTDWRYLDVNRAWGELVGIDPTAAIGRTIREVFPGIEEAWVDEFTVVVETGQSTQFTRQVGALARWYDGRAFPLGGDRFGVLFLETTERVQAETRRTALLSLGDRLRDLHSVEAMTMAACETLGVTLDAMLVGYGDVDPQQETITVARDWTTGGAQTLAGQLNFRDFGSYIEDLKRDRTVIVRDCRTDPRTRDHAAALEERSARAFVNTPVFERGVIVALLYVSTAKPRDWTEQELAFIRDVASRLRLAIGRVRAEERQDLLNHELSHRLKNTLAIVQSIAGQTLRAIPERGPIEAFERRIMALSRAHDVLLQDAWAPASLRAVAVKVLEPHAMLDRFDLAGPEIGLVPSAVLSLSLLLHELATNAAKYGSLSVEGGRVHLTWVVLAEAEAKLEVRWQECGGPPATAPTGRGFGSRLIRTGLMGTRDVTLDYSPVGLEASFRAPLAEVKAS